MLDERIIQIFKKQKTHFLTPSGDKKPVYEYTTLLERFFSGAGDHAVTMLRKNQSILYEANFFEVLKYFADFGVFGNTPWSRAYIMWHNDNDYCALSTLLEASKVYHTNVFGDRRCCGAGPEVLEDELRYLPKGTLHSLVSTLLCTLGITGTWMFDQWIQLHDWIRKCSEAGWIAFQPYILVDENKCPMLVMKYNRVLKFNGKQWVILSGARENSVWQAGQPLWSDLWGNQRNDLSTALLFAGGIAVGSHMSEFVKLYQDRSGILTSFFAAVEQYVGAVPTGSSVFELFDRTVFEVEDVVPMQYRLHASDNTDYARFTLCPGFRGYIDVPRGNQVRTVLYDFNQCVGSGPDAECIIAHAMPEARVLFLTCALALASVVMNDRVAYAMDKQNVMRADWYSNQKLVYHAIDTRISIS